MQQTPEDKEFFSHWDELADKIDALPLTIFAIYGDDTAKIWQRLQFVCAGLEKQLVQLKEMLEPTR